MMGLKGVRSLKFYCDYSHWSKNGTSILKNRLTSPRTKRTVKRCTGKVSVVPDDTVVTEVQKGQRRERML